MSGGTRSYEMARRLVEWGHEVHMITTDRRDTPVSSTTKWRETEEAGIRVHWTCIPYSNKMSYGERIKAFFAFAWRAARKAVEIGGDVVFATSTPLTIAIPGVYASKRLKVPMVFEVRDLWPEVPIALGVLKNPLSKRAALWLERFAYNNASHIVALAPGMKDHIVQKGYPEEKVTVIPNGADIELFDVPEAVGKELRRRYDWLGDRPMVLYAGTLGVVNGVEYLVDLAAAVRTIAPEIRFVVLGSGKEEERLKEYAERQGVLNHTVFMLGQIPKDEMPAWFSAASATISLIIDRKENWQHATTNKFFDSLAAGRPVLNNHPGWQTSIALQHECGLQLNRAVEYAASELISFLQNKERLIHARTMAKQLAREIFDRKLLAAQLNQVFSAIAR